MVRVGVTGHIGLLPSARDVLFHEVLQRLREFPVVHGITCLAAGADRIFAEAIRACRGTFEVVLPVPESHPADDDPGLHELLRHASDVSRMSVPGPPEASYEAASREMLARCDVLIAVWDGDETGGRGGTAQTVARAREQGKRVVVVWPTGAARLPAQAV